MLEPAGADGTAVASPTDAGAAAGREEEGAGAGEARDAPAELEAELEAGGVSSPTGIDGAGEAPDVIGVENAAGGKREGVDWAMEREGAVAEGGAVV